MFDVSNNVRFQQWQVFVKFAVLPIGILGFYGSLFVVSSYRGILVLSSRMLLQFNSIFQGFTAVLCLIVCLLHMELWSPVGCVLNQSFKDRVGLYSKLVIKLISVFCLPVYVKFFQCVKHPLKPTYVRQASYLFLRCELFPLCHSWGQMSGPRL
jgi:hypothetical protein